MNLLLILLASLAGAHFTYLLCQKRGMNPVRASALLSLLFCVLASLAAQAKASVIASNLDNLPIQSLQLAFFGGTFVGMSEARRLCERRVLLAGAVFAVVDYFLAEANPGIGGFFGLAAFAACLIIAILKPMKPKETSHE
jgi:hypothetical protein